MMIIIIYIIFSRRKLHQFLLSQEQQDGCGRLWPQQLLNVNVTDIADVAYAPHFQATVEESDNRCETRPHL